MNTPIVDFLDRCASDNAVRLHMPGHKGTLDPFDITEVPGADVLYHAQGVIRESEENAARLFASGRTLFSAEGSSLCIRAMLYLLALYARQEKKPLRILAARNAHQTFVTAAALLDFEVDWLMPANGTVLSCVVSPEELAKAIDEAHPAAVFLTSPDYLGQQQALITLGALCKRKNVLLFVDNAHGAYLRFLSPSLHPLSCGAALCCDSAHKTLPALTGAAYLHIAKDAPALFSREAERAMALFASTSPPYPILRSLDLLNRALEEDFPAHLAAFAEKVGEVKRRLFSHGFTLVGDEPLKLTLAAKPYGYTGFALADYLAQKKLIAEMADPDYTVLMLAPDNGFDSLEILCDRLLRLPRRPALKDAPPPLTRPTQALDAREALLSPAEELPLAKCAGRVLSAPTVSCPPAVPIAVCGEMLDEASLALMRYYGQTTCRVVKNA